MSPSLLAPLQAFAGTVTAKMAQLTLGAPEDQLRAPFETFMAAVGSAFGLAVVCTGETPLPDRLGAPTTPYTASSSWLGTWSLRPPAWR